jgi:outer membrane protein
MLYMHHTEMYPACPYMKTFLCTLVAVLPLLLVLSQKAEAQSRIATVDLQKAFNNYWKKKEVEKGLNVQGADLEKEAKAMLESRNKADEEARSLLAAAKDEAASPDERQKRQNKAEEKLKQVRDLEENLVQYERQAKTTLDEQSQRVRTKLFKDITEVIGAKARAGGFTLVLNSGPQTDPVSGTSSLSIVLYASAGDDLTEAVITELNATAPVANPEEEAQPAKNQKKSLQKP